MEGPAVVATSMILHSYASSIIINDERLYSTFFLCVCARARMVHRAIAVYSIAQTAQACSRDIEELRRRVTTTTTWYNAPKVCELLLISGPNTRSSSRDFLRCVKKARCVWHWMYVLLVCTFSSLQFIALS